MRGKFVFLFVLLVFVLSQPVLANEGGFEVDTTSIKSVIALGDTLVDEIVITNTELQSLSISVAASIDSINLSESTFTLSPKESKTVSIFISNPDKINTFEVSVKSATFEQVIPAVVEMESGEFNIDALLKINETFKDIKAGKNLVAGLDFFALEDLGTQKITVDIAIYDLKNNQISSISKDEIISNRKLENISALIPPFLKSGEYILSIVMNQGSDSWSTATDSFNVQGKFGISSITLNLQLFLILLALLALGLLFFWTYNHIKSVDRPSKSRVVTKVVTKVVKKGSDNFEEPSLWARFRNWRSARRLDKKYEKRDKLQEQLRGLNKELKRDKITAKLANIDDSIEREIEHQKQQAKHLRNLRKEVKRLKK